MREAVDVGKAGFELGENFKNSVGVVLDAQALGNLLRVLVRAGNETDRAGRKHGKHSLCHLR